MLNCFPLGAVLKVGIFILVFFNEVQKVLHEPGWSLAKRVVVQGKNFFSCLNWADTFDSCNKSKSEKKYTQTLNKTILNYFVEGPFISIRRFPIKTKKLDKLLKIIKLCLLSYYQGADKVQTCALC